MTFRTPGTDGPMPVWREYYANKGVPIPEGKPSCNPGGLSRSENLLIPHAFGRPTGWTEDTYTRHAAWR